MKLLNLTAALLLGSVLQAQNPLPAVHPQPQEITLSTNRLKSPHGFTLTGIKNPDEDAMRLIKQTFRSLSINHHAKRNQYRIPRQPRSFLRCADTATIDSNRRAR